MVSRSIIQLFHILFVSILFIYVGINKNENPLWIYKILIGLGIMVFCYHFYKAYNRTSENYPWINHLHYFYIGPLLIYIGYHQDKTKRIYYELLLMMGFAAIGYHSFYYISGSD